MLKIRFINQRFPRNPGEKSSYQVALEVINIFKEWVEYNRGWDVIQSADSRKREKIVQRLIHLGAKNYITTNKMDISFEPDAGRGPVDFKPKFPLKLYLGIANEIRKPMNTWFLSVFPLCKSIYNRYNYI